MPDTSLRRRQNRRKRKKRAVFLAVGAALLLLTILALIFLLSGPEPPGPLYPLAYRDLIERYAAEYFLDPAHVASVIYCESSFRPDALSPAGAMGLMQLMPDTGRWIAGQLGETCSEDCLYEPETNIRYGCWYLDYLSGCFDCDRVKLTAAYHAGENRVRQWLQDPACSADGITLSAIPSQVTADYVEKVEKMITVYEEIMRS